jgi:hypothetical protein
MNVTQCYTYIRNLCNWRTSYVFTHPLHEIPGFPCLFYGLLLQGPSCITVSLYHLRSLAVPDVYSMIYSMFVLEFHVSTVYVCNSVLYSTVHYIRNLCNWRTSDIFGQPLHDASMTILC